MPRWRSTIVLDDGQAEPGAGRGVAGDAVEALEHALALRGRDARARVDHGAARLPAPTRRARDRDRAARAARSAARCRPGSRAASAAPARLPRIGTAIRRVGAQVDVELLGARRVAADHLARERARGRAARAARSRTPGSRRAKSSSCCTRRRARSMPRASSSKRRAARAAASARARRAAPAARAPPPASAARARRRRGSGAARRARLAGARAAR